MEDGLVSRGSSGWLRSLRERYKLRRFRRLFRKGEKLTRFIAPDIRRDIEVLDDSRASEGIVVAKVRTMNVLYAAKGLAEESEFGAPEIVSFSNAWKWDGPHWGGTDEPERTSVPLDQMNPSKSEIG